MALITCSECGNEYSDKAAACPVCACPTTEQIKEVGEADPSAKASINKSEPPRKSDLKGYLAGLTAVGVGLLVAFSGGLLQKDGTDWSLGYPYKYYDDEQKAFINTVKAVGTTKSVLGGFYIIWLVGKVPD